MLLKCFLLSVLMWGSLAQGITVSDLTFYTTATGSFQFDLPRLIGPNDDILSGSVDASTLQYGSIRQVVDWTYEYTPAYARVDPNGCTDVASYTMTDNKGFSATAAIRIDIGANSAPSVYGQTYETYVSFPVRINVTDVANDPDREPISFSKVGAVKYGTISMTSDIIMYTPIPALVNPQTGAKEAFTYSVMDARGGNGSAVFEVHILPNSPPVLSVDAYFTYYNVDKNNSLMLDMQLNIPESDRNPVLVRDVDGDPLTAVLDSTNVLKFGVLTTMGNGLYKYHALPGVGGSEVEVIPVKVTDGRGGEATGNFWVNIRNNEDPIVVGVQSVVTLSTTPVVIAPLVNVREYEQNNTDVLVVNITTPRYGTLKLLSCCNKVNVYTLGFYGKINNGMNIADYLYTPFNNISSEVTDNLTYTVMDQHGGYATGLISVAIKPYPTCVGDLVVTRGVIVSGFVALQEDYYHTDIPQCGGAFTFTNCFNGNTENRRNMGCMASKYFTTDDVYTLLGTGSPYSNQTNWVCLLPSRKSPCTDKNDPKAAGITMWQDLATVSCSAECEKVTEKYSVPGSAVTTLCNGCITCEPNCSSFNGDQVVGPEVCCIGAAGTSNVSKPVCADCTKEAAAPVCGSDGNTYITACAATCQGVNVTSPSPCPGTPTMLDLTKVPDFSSAKVMQLMQDGFQVYGVAKTGEPLADDDDDGFGPFRRPSFAQDVDVHLGNNMSAASAPTSKAQPCAPATRISPEHFQMHFVYLDDHGKPTLAGLKPPVIEKIFRAYNQVIKINNQIKSETPGPFKTFKLLEKMTYPYTAIGLVTMHGRKVTKRCTGWQVSSTIVVTAAHCVVNRVTKLPVNPEYFTFEPRVWGGISSGPYSFVKAIALPGWYVQMDSSDCREDRAKWDMAVLHLSESLPCAPGCYLRPSIIIGKYAYTSYMLMAGYGAPAGLMRQMNISLPCAANLLPGMAYSYNKCALYHGHSGAPFWPSAKGIPAGVLPFSWPAFGVLSGWSHSKSSTIMCQFTAAHLKWLHWAGLKTALACTVDQKGSATCANYKYLAS